MYIHRAIRLYYEIIAFENLCHIRANVEGAVTMQDKQLI